MEQDIIYQRQVVGTAKMKQEGMFLIVQCRCTISPNVPHKIAVHSQKTLLDLGLCVKEPQGCGLLTRVCVSKFPKEPVQFCLEEVHQEQFVPVRPDIPLPSAEILKDGRFAVKNGIAGIVIGPKAQFPDQQGNGQIP